MTIPAAPRRYTGKPASRASRAGPASLSDDELAGRVMSSLASCSGAATDPDEWFPVAAVVTAARAEAERALALCTVCPVRAECLEMSLRQWRTIGKHGIWGGLVEAERAAAHREWLAGAEVTALLALPAARPGGAPGPEAGPPERVRVTGLGSSPRTPRRPAAARSAGKQTLRRGTRAAGLRPRPLVEQ
jgi:hypothetical protein